MSFKKIAAIAAMSLLTVSNAAVAQSAQSLSVAPVAARSGADLQDSNELRGTTGWIIAAVALALIIWGAIELFDDDDPESP